MSHLAFHFLTWNFMIWEIELCSPLIICNDPFLSSLTCTHDDKSTSEKNNFYLMFVIIKTNHFCFLYILCFYKLSSMIFFFLLISVIYQWKWRGYKSCPDDFDSSILNFPAVCPDWNCYFLKGCQKEKSHARNLQP